MKTLFCHPKFESSERFTVAGIVEDSTLKIGVALCSSRDKFQKKIGRSIAEGRIKAGKQLFDISIDYNSFKEVSQEFYEQVKVIKATKINDVRKLMKE